ncbi:MAG: DNA repair protein RecO [Armatimonadota bacterium]
MATYHALTITLRCQRLREADRILSLLAREQGRIEAVVKGVGKPKSKLTPVTQLFSCNRLMLAEGRSLDTVAQVQVVDAFYALREDPRRLGHAAYVAELVTKTSERGQESTELFDLVRGTLRALCEAADLRLVTHAFEARFLDLHGYGIPAEACLGCEQDLSGRRLGFSPREGGFYCGRCAASGGVAVCAGTVRTLARLQERGLAGLERLSPTRQVREELRSVLRAHLDFHVGARLRSLEFLRSLEKAGASRRTGRDNAGRLRLPP